jgi:hypothetical protein
MKTTFLTVSLLVLVSLSLAAPQSGGTAPAAPAIDGEQVYKTNCTRCHNTPPAMSLRQTKAVVRHMRVRANLPAEDAAAVLQYLSESARR